MQHEFQMAYEWSSLQQFEKNARAIPEIPPGCFAVVNEYLDYCPVTDATLRNPGRKFIRMCGSRRIAEYFAKRLTAEDEYGESWGTVYPKLPEPPRPVSEDIRF